MFPPFFPKLSGFLRFHRIQSFRFGTLQTNHLDISLVTQLVVDLPTEKS